MDNNELEALVRAAEEKFRTEVVRELSAVQSEYLDGIEAATELVAARFSVSSISRLWRARVPSLLSSLRGIFRDSAQAVADDLEEPLPEGWEEEPAAAYEKATEPLLNAVGEHMAEVATRTLTDGLNEGDSLEELKARLRATFDESSFEMGPVRADMIALTEATRAWNAGTLAAAEALTGEDRPLVKQWRTRGDSKVRQAHRDVNGQLQLLDDPFQVSGTPMAYPGDPTAPADLTVNCRCVLKVEAPPRGETVTASDDGADFASRMPPQLKAYWLTGPGAAKIRWGTPGAFDRCVRNLRDDFPQDPEGLCANLYHDATGRWPGQKKESSAYSDSGMIALIPSAADAARLALEGGEEADQLHCTLMFLGDITSWPEDTVQNLIQEVAQVVRDRQPVRARLFGVNHWNPASETPAWVWATGDHDESPTTLGQMRTAAEMSLDYAGLLSSVPEQHSPWVAHVTGAYAADEWPRGPMTERCGPITFDRIRVAIGDTHYDIPLMEPEPMPEPVPEDVPMEEDASVQTVPGFSVAAWSTPDPIALAFENQETGDGRIFAPGSLYWEGGPWPLQYADEMLEGHMGAQLAGSITGMYRVGGRLAGEGLLYTDRQAGWDVHCLLSQGAPVGVSVDLDDVTMEFVSKLQQDDVVLSASLAHASVLRLPDGTWTMDLETASEWVASGTSMGGASTTVRLFTEEDGTLPADVIMAAFGADLTAAAGDPDSDGQVIGRESSGDVIVRITRARVRGATVVTIPAYATATIALEAPGAMPTYVEMYASSGDPQWEVVQCVRSSLTPLTAAEVSQALQMPIQAVRDHLARATEKGLLVRIARGLYVGPLQTSAVTAAVSGAVELPVADKAREWDGEGATGRVFDWADGDASRIGQAFLWRDPDADPTTKAAYKLGYADVIDGELTIVPRGVFAAAGALQGARGGVDIPESDVADVKDRVDALYARMRDELNDDSLHSPWESDDESMAELEASAWTALQDLPAMPAAWFREPTVEELPPGSGGVHYANGRIFGWVAQAGEPHAGFAQKITIDSLGSIDTSHFLRQRFTLDNGATVKAGAFTMNVGHHRDGAECETSSCQFDDTRTVAGVVTVGMNERGMWFSGAAAPWLSEWDRVVFQACQPSYHLKKGPGGKWQLRAVLSVPVPGHSSPLLASAVAERASMALAASAAMAQPEPETEPALTVVEGVGYSAVRASIVPEGIDYARLADEIVAATARAEAKREEDAALMEVLRAEAADLARLTEINASAAQADAAEGEES